MNKYLFALTLLATRFVAAQQASIISLTNSAITYPSAGLSINSSTPIIMGVLKDSRSHAVSGALVSITLDNTLIGTATSASDGRWQYQLSSDQALADGSHVLTVAIGGASGQLGPLTFITSTGSPQTPTISYPASGATIISKTFLVSGTTNPTYVIDLIINGNDSLSGLIYPNAQGNWTTTITLANGTYNISARAIDSSYNLSPSSTPISVTVNA